MDGHTQCSTHAPCISQPGNDLLSYPVCEMWIQKCRAAFLEVRSNLPTLENLRRAWQKIRKLKTLCRHSAMWADPSQGAVLGLTCYHYHRSCICILWTAPQPLSQVRCLVRGIATPLHGRFYFHPVSLCSFEPWLPYTRAPQAFGPLRSHCQGRGFAHQVSPPPRSSHRL